MTTTDAETAPSAEKTGDAGTPPAPAAFEQQRQSPWRAPLAFLVMGLLLVIVGAFQSWSVALAILNMSLISALMAMGLNLQWGYAGLFNAGVMAFTALGGLAAVVVSHPPVWDALAAGGRPMALSGVILIAMIATVTFAGSAFAGKLRKVVIVAVVVIGYVLLRPVFTEAVSAIEAVDPARTGFIGGLGMVLGNGMTGVALAIRAITAGLVDRRAAVEAQLSLGRSFRQAVLPMTRSALRTALTPTINSMAATGLVYLPGMMTGQILAGIDPVEAVKYQLLVMFLIGGATGVGVTVVVFSVLRRLTDTRHRLRLDRLSE